MACHAGPREARFIVGWRDADWLLVAIPTLGFDLSDGQAGGWPDFSQGLKAARKVGEGLAAGLEAYSPAARWAIACPGSSRTPACSSRWTSTASPGSSTLVLAVA